MNKTCGECKHLNRELAFCRACGARWLNKNDGANCKYFEKITPPTNGDRIQQGGNRAIAKFAYKTARTHICGMCAFATIENGRYVCNAKDGQSCVDGIEAWLNAPAKSEVK